MVDNYILCLFPFLAGHKGRLHFPASPTVYVGIWLSSNQWNVDGSVEELLPDRAHKHLPCVMTSKDSEVPEEDEISR